ncbi:beta-propeller fold lactonase family protein [Streptomyces sp. MNP-20]|uniref:Vgb family protein n=1 Tax=Streptomyces sp. MNP-20 TaxID=2721165 RepID=UPI0015526046|nr:beta-propeller fold lactonase family protein [Streptomyces sp. MNP-20]
MVAGDYVYALGGGGDLGRVTLTDGLPQERVLSQCPSAGFTVVGSTGYFLDGTSLSRADLAASPVKAPVPIVRGFTNATSVSVQGDWAYVTDGKVLYKAAVTGESVSSSPGQVVARCPEDLLSVAVSGTAAYLLSATTLYRADLATAARPVPVVTGFSAGQHTGHNVTLDSAGTTAYLMNTAVDLYSVDLTQAAPAILNKITPDIPTLTKNGPGGVDVAGAILYAMDQQGDLFAVDLAPPDTPLPVPADVHLEADGHTLAWTPGTGAGPYTQTGYTITLATASTLTTPTTQAPVTTLDLNALKIPHTDLNLTIQSTRGNTYSPSTSTVTLNHTQSSDTLDSWSVSLTSPNYLAVSPDGTYLYVAGGGSVQRVNLTDPKNDTPDSWTVTSGLGSPNGLAVSPNGTYLYITDETKNKVVRVSLKDPNDDTPDSSWQVVSGLGSPGGLAVSPHGTYLYITSESSNTIQRVNLTDPKNDTPDSTWQVTSGLGYPTALAVSPDGTYLYIANYNNANVQRVNLTDPKNYTPDSWTVTLASANGLAVSPHGTYLYMANQGGDTVQRVSLADPENETPDSTWQVTSGLGSPAGLAVSPDGTYLYITNEGGNTVRRVVIGTGWHQGK